MTETAQEFYGRWSRLYDGLARHTPGIRRLRADAAAACRLEPGDAVVEMGCGTGANLPFLREAVGPEGTVVGVDFTRPVLDRARAQTAAHDNVHLVRADASEPPLPPAVRGDVDAVLATFVVGMLSDPARAVDEWCDLLGPAGTLVLVNAARSDSETWYGPAIDAAFRAVVVLSTPPTTQIAYENDPVERLDRRIESAHGRLRERATEVVDRHYALGTVRLTGGLLR